MILAAFALLGYIGVKGIGSIRADFKSELEKLGGLRKEFEGKIMDVNNQLHSAKTTVDEMAKVNLEQDRRLQILEIQEKCSSLYAQKNYSRALEYANLGLELSKKDFLLMTTRAACLMKMGMFKEACASCEEALEINPGSVNVLSNLVEISVLAGNHDRARALIKANDASFTNAYGPYFAWYITALVKFFSGNPTELKAHIAQQPVQTSEEKTRRIKESWSYDEALYVIRGMQSQPGFKEILGTIEFLKGNLGLKEFNQLVSGAA